MNEFDEGEFDEYNERNVKNNLKIQIEEEFIPRDEPNENLRNGKTIPDLDGAKRIAIDEDTIESVVNDLKTKKIYLYNKLVRELALILKI